VADGFHLGKLLDGGELVLDPDDLTTHAVIVGMTGSGKTGLGIVLLEEALGKGIPALILDPKGDMGNLALTFPDLSPASFRPWIDESAARDAGQTPDEYAEKTAELWRSGLERSGIGPEAVGMVMVASGSSGRAFPGPAAIVAKRLGCESAVALDLPMASAGSLFGISLASRLADIARTGEGRVGGLLIGEIDGVPATDHALAQYLVEAGFVRSALGFQVVRERHRPSFERKPGVPRWPREQVSGEV